MAAEILTLDPVSENAANAQLVITTGSYGLIEHHYPQPPLVAQWASSADTEGAAIGSRRHENRQISITLDVDGLSALRALQAKLTKLHREGGTLKRTLSDATVIVFDVFAVEGYDPDFGHAFDLGGVTTVSFTLTCAPYGRGPEITLSSHSETTSPVLVFTETGIKGDIPALGTLRVTDASGQAQAVAVWGMRSRNYDSASTAALLYEAEALELASGAVVAASPPSGASGGSCVEVTPTTSYVTRVLLSNPITGTARTHVGSYRVFVRAQAKATNTGTISMQLGWAPLPATGFALNTPQSINAAREGVWQILDLGLISAAADLYGGWHSWFGALQVKSTASLDKVFIDHVFLVPTDDGYGMSTSITGAGGLVPVNANLSLVVTSSGAFSETLLGAGKYGPAPAYVGSYLRVPVAGAEGRTVQILVKLIRGRNPGWIADWDDGTDDPAIDDLTAQLSYVPRYLVVPSP